MEGDTFRKVILGTAMGLEGLTAMAAGAIENLMSRLEKDPTADRRTR